jgi:hypothetical protein
MDFGARFVMSSRFLASGGFSISTWRSIACGSRWSYGIGPRSLLLSKRVCSSREILGGAHTIVGHDSPRGESRSTSECIEPCDHFLWLDPHDDAPAMAGHETDTMS